MKKIVKYIKFYWLSLKINIFFKKLNGFYGIDCSYSLATLYFNRGNILSNLKRYSEAIEDFTKSKEIAGWTTDQEDYSFNRGIAYSYLNKHKEAISDFSHYLRSNSQDKEAYYCRAASYLAINMFKEALDDLNESISGDPRDTLFRYLKEIGLKLEEKERKDIFIEKVQAFQEKMFGPISRQPLIPIEKKCQLRVNLLQEELDELKVGIKDKNIVAITDALCDLQYVLSGAIIEFGLGDRFPQLFNEVHRSNMSKFCDNKMLALKTQEKYQKKGVENYFKEVDGKFLVYRKKDDKLLKGINYSPADLSSVTQTEIIFSKS